MGLLISGPPNIIFFYELLLLTHCVSRNVHTAALLLSLSGRPVSEWAIAMRQTGLNFSLGMTSTLSLCT